MSETETTKLLDLFRAYPNGVAGLVEDSEIGMPVIYKLAAGKHANAPTHLLNLVSQAFGKRSMAKVLGMRTDSGTLLRLWRAARAQAEAENPEAAPRRRRAPKILARKRKVRSAA